MPEHSMTCEEKITSEEYGELLLDYALGNVQEMEGLADTCRISIDPQISIVYFRRERGAEISFENYPFYSFPKCYGLMQTNGEGASNAGSNRRDGQFDPLSLADAGILQIQRPPLSLTGRGCVIGFIDTGIRYTMDVFRAASGESRILSIWDQTLSGIPPSGYGYGAVYDRMQINEALSSEYPRQIVPSWDEDGHGTAAASVAAGSILDGGSAYIGAAPDADIVVVKLRQAKQYLRDYYVIPEGALAYAETDILTAVKYVESYGEALRRPVIICIGLGSSYGSHTGSSILSRYLNALALKRSRVVIACGGNEGDAAHHAQLSAASQTQTVELRIGEGEKGFLLSFWGEGPGNHTLSVRTPGGEAIREISTARRSREEYRFVFEETQVTAESVPLEEVSGRSLILLRFFNPSAGIWRFFINSETLVAGGRSDLWLPITDFLSGDTYFLRPEPDVTLTEPSMAQEVITINAYRDADGSFYERSGRGFTADRRSKPDFTAPGVDVPTILGRQSGSSIAAAMAAGAAAQFMQWAVVEQNYPLAAGRELKYYLALGAVRMDGISYPSREWGLGTINLQRTFQELAGLF